MMPACRARFDALKLEVEADSYSEVLARALFLLEKHIDEPVDTAVFPTPQKGDGCTERFNILLQPRTIERFQRLRKVYLERGENLQAMEIVRRALRLFYKANEELKKHTAGGQKLRSDNPAHRLALLIL
ncbi:MAG: hypothetical protein EBQ96_05800 [Proteobacteria bacterium]|nr:hypothetical protein [Pseudomonadota bacterium]